MSIFKIARMGHPVLKRRAEEIPEPWAPEIAALIEDMLDTMADADGLGLAAPQVHVGLRLVVFRVPPPDIAHEEDLDRDVLPVRALINPVIEPLTEDMKLGWEGCLSVPGLRGKVRRYTKIRFSGALPDGTAVDEEAEGLYARVLQHECDHLDGILYPMRMDDMSTLIFESEWKHLRDSEAESDAGSEEDESDAGREEDELERTS